MNHTLHTNKQFTSLYICQQVTDSQTVEHLMGRYRKQANDTDVEDSQRTYSKMQECYVGSYLPNGVNLLDPELFF
jgi:hypothetical protein